MFICPGWRASLFLTRAGKNLKHLSANSMAGTYLISDAFQQFFNPIYVQPACSMNSFPQVTPPRSCFIYFSA